jgi:hypothetical protein
MGRPFVATMIGGGMGGLRFLAAVAGRKLTPFHGVDGADALHDIGITVLFAAIVTILACRQSARASLENRGGRNSLCFSEI